MTRASSAYPQPRVALRFSFKVRNGGAVYVEPSGFPWRPPLNYPCNAHRGLRFNFPPSVSSDRRPSRLHYHRKKSSIGIACSRFVVPRPAAISRLKVIVVPNRQKNNPSMIISLLGRFHETSNAPYIFIRLVTSSNFIAILERKSFVSARRVSLGTTNTLFLFFFFWRTTKGRFTIERRLNLIAGTLVDNYGFCAPNPPIPALYPRYELNFETTLPMFITLICLHQLFRDSNLRKWILIFL